MATFRSNVDGAPAPDPAMPRAKSLTGDRGPRSATGHTAARACAVNTSWSAEGGAFRAELGRWTVRVSQPPGLAGWEWVAFASGAGTPRALGCRGFSAPEAARLDAENTLRKVG